MFELIINNVVYQFHFGMGFMREINKKIGTPVDGLPDVKKNIGLQYYIAGIIDNDLEALVTVLEVANKNQKPRITPAVLDSYIDDPDTDIDKLFESVLDFLKNANATRKTVANLLNLVEQQTNQK
jgi:hypothetical protein